MSEVKEANEGSVCENNLHPKLNYAIPLTTNIQN